MKRHHQKKHESKKESISLRHIFLDVIILAGIMIAVVGLGLVPNIQQNLVVLGLGVFLLTIGIVALFNPKALRMPKLN